MRKSKSYKLKGIKFSVSENYGFGTKKNRRTAFAEFSRFFHFLLGRAMESFRDGKDFVPLSLAYFGK